MLPISGRTATPVLAGLGGLALTLGAWGAEPMALRLERALEDRPPPTAVASPTLMRFGLSDLQRRIEESRYQLQGLREDTARLNEALQQREREIARLRSLDEIQSAVLSASREAMVALERGQLAASAQVPAALPSAAPPTTSSAPPPASPVPRTAPGSLSQWTVPALGVAVVLLLAAVAWLYRRNRTLATSVAMPSVPPPARPQPPPEATLRAVPDEKAAAAGPTPPAAPVPDESERTVTGLSPLTTAASGDARPGPDRVAGPSPAATRPAPVSEDDGPPTVRHAPDPGSAPAREAPDLGSSLAQDAADLGSSLARDAAELGGGATPAAPSEQSAPLPARAAFTGEDATPEPDPGDTLPPLDYTPPQTGAGWSHATIARKAADPQALKEVDVLIAFEEFEKAKGLLDELLSSDPENPEYLLRRYHVRTAGGIDTHADDEELLRAMMDGPLSDTMVRVRAIGQGLMPGNPLFEDDSQREAAKTILKEEGTPLRTSKDQISERDLERTLVMRLEDKE